MLEVARTTAPDAISTAAIAERMGVSHGALFRHFPSREALWAEAVSWATGELERPATSTARETGKAFMQRFGLRLATLIGAAQAEPTSRNTGTHRRRPAPW
ncbi:MAG: TetR family transcriptional regulator [Cyanobacteria bacterium]|nr:TetR family transcriptional regulator [Cyanobacteriota bacterium]